MGQMSLWGALNCLKCLCFNIFLLFSDLNYFLEDPAHFITPLIATNKNKIKGISRIGPHDQIILSIIFGSLLGYAHAQKINGGVGTRINFYQESTHVSYLLWLHSLLANSGYCNENKPQIQTSLGAKGVVRKVMKVSTWTYTSFNFIQELFYFDNKKRVPLNINEYLTPLALAIWIMEDGVKVSKGLKFYSQRNSYADCLLLIDALHFNFKLKASVQSAGNQYNVYIWKESMSRLREIVSPHIIKEMKYKIIE